jgi:hypothetical protein
MRKIILWVELAVFIMVTAIAIGGCAMDNQRLMETEARYRHHIGLEMDPDSTKDWNSTDWSLWGTMQGGS